MVAIDRRAQFRQQRQALLAHLVEDRVIHHRLVTAAFGCIHRHLGAAQQQFGIRAMRWITGDADSRTEVDGLFFQGKRNFERFEDTDCHSLRIIDVRIGQQDRKLVAAQARQLIPSIRQLQGQPLGHQAQQRIAEAMTHHVIDGLEAVQVHHQDGAGAVALPGLRDGVGEHDRELCAVRQIGERVPVRQPADFQFAIGDAIAHAGKGFGQFADFVFPLDFDLALISSGTQALGNFGQPAQRSGNAFGGENAARDRNRDAERGQDQHLDLEPRVGRDRFADRTLQHDDCALRGIRRQRHDAGAKLIAGNREVREGGDVRRRAVQLAGQAGDVGRGQGRGIRCPLAGLAAREDRDLESGQRVHIRRQPLVDRKDHRHPADRHRRLDRDDHDLVRIVVDDADSVRAAALFGLVHQVQNRLSQIGRRRGGGRLDLMVRRDQQRERGADVGTLVG